MRDTVQALDRKSSFQLFDAVIWGSNKNLLHNTLISLPRTVGIKLADRDQYLKAIK